MYRRRSGESQRNGTETSWPVARTAEKIARMEAAGISVAERIEEIPDLIRKRLEAAGS